MTSIALSTKAAKLMKLCEAEGFAHLDDLLAAAICDSVGLSTLQASGDVLDYFLGRQIYPNINYNQIQSQSSPQSRQQPVQNYNCGLRQAVQLWLDSGARCNGSMKTGFARLCQAL